MKKTLSAIGIGSLMLVLLLTLSFTSVSASNVQSSASDVSSFSEPQKTYSRFVSEKRSYAHFPPSTVTYNEHGYNGTLTRVDDWKIGGTYYGVYEGYVYCTGVCPLTLETEE